MPRIFPILHNVASKQAVQYVPIVEPGVVFTLHISRHACCCSAAALQILLVGEMCGFRGMFLEISQEYVRCMRSFN